MMAIRDYPLIGTWRIVEADLWDCDYLDIVEPASSPYVPIALAKIAFPAMQASLDLEYSQSTVLFTWAGYDEMDEVSGSGSAELLDDGSIEIEFAHHLGEEAGLKGSARFLRPVCDATENATERATNRERLSI